MEIMPAKFAAWRDNCMLFLINRYRPDCIENAPLNIKNFPDEYMDDNNIFAQFCNQYVQKSDD